MVRRGNDKAPAAREARWDPALYDTRHSFVWKFGAEVIALLSPQRGERILDLGCGTGHLTHQIALSGAKVVGLDLSPGMIEQARKNYPGLSFVIGEGAGLPFAEPFDAVFSNAALHWMREPARVARSVAAALKPKGRFVAEFGGKGNMRAFHEALERAAQAVGCPAAAERRPLYFPSIGEYASLLEQQGLAVRHAVLFDRPTPLEEGENGLRNWLGMFASDVLAAIAPEKLEEVIRKVEDQLRPALFQDGTWFADYRRIRVLAVRE